ISGKSAPVASRKRPIPSRVSAERLRGESTGSRHSSRGSRRPESHSKVEEVILKHNLNESGFCGITEWTRSSSSTPAPAPLSSSVESDSEKWVRFRFLGTERKEKVVAISAVERKQ
ncbi:unnamed protein product, partial [Ilex paraguariensis]